MFDIKHRNMFVFDGNFTYSVPHANNQLTSGKQKKEPLTIINLYLMDFKKRYISPRCQTRRFACYVGGKD